MKNVGDSGISTCAFANGQLSATNLPVYSGSDIHFLPFHGSWLNLVENWFGIMKKNCLDGRSVRSKEEMGQNIMDFTETWGKNYAHPFKWTYEGKEIRGKTVRKFTYWLHEESSTMSGKFLGKQLKLMANLIEIDWEKVSTSDWHCLGVAIDQKQKYLSRVVESINAGCFKDIKAKTPEERVIKIINKVKEAKQVLSESIANFKIQIDTALASMSNREKCSLIQ